MTCSRDKIAAVEKTKKKRVPCFGFDKVSYNARYTNIRGVKKPLFRILGLLASPASIWACWACGMRFLRYACISCVSFYVYDCTYAHVCVFHCGLLFDFAFSLKGAPSCAKLFPAPAPSFLHCGLGAAYSPPAFYGALRWRPFRSTTGSFAR